MDKTLSKLSKLPYFRTSHLEALLPYLKKPSLYQKISRWLKKGEIIELKKGYKGRAKIKSMDEVANIFD